MRGMGGWGLCGGSAPRDWGREATWEEGREGKIKRDGATLVARRRKACLHMGLGRKARRHPGPVVAPCSGSIPYRLSDAVAP